MPEALSLAGWRRTVLADGVMLVAPDGPAAGVIRIRTRVRPQVSIRELAAFLTRQIPGRFGEVTVDEPVRFATLEGEYAVMLALRARDGAEELRRTVAIVLGDDSYDAVDGAASRPDAFDRVRAAVETLADRSWLGLGERRRRRYFYQVPAGWQGIALPQWVDWLAPDFPRDRAILSVLDARPLGQTPYLRQNQELFLDLPAQLVRDAPPPSQDLVTRLGLRGSLSIVPGRLPGGPTELTHEAVLTDDNYAYIVRLTCGEARLDEHRGVLMELVSSIEPLPVEGRSVAMANQWAE
jgi:hypothetical protein